MNTTIPKPEGEDESTNKSTQPSHYVYIPLDVEVKSELRVLQESLSAEAMKYDLEEVGISHTHITLGVFDLLPSMKLYSRKRMESMKKQILLEVMENLRNFEVKLLRLGHFGGRFVYVEVERTEELLDLRSKVLDAFEKRNIPCTDDRTYIPHITLFKSSSFEKEVEEETKSSLLEYLSSVEFPDMKTVRIDDVLIRKIGGGR